MIPTLAQQALALALALPAFALTVLTLGLLVDHPPSERRVHQLVAGSMGSALVFASALLLALLAGHAPVSVDLGTPIAVRSYHFSLLFRADLPGALYLWLDLFLCALISAFSERYLHREPGYHRFYVLLLAFTLGIAIIATASGLDLLFAGWELVGLASALLIGFFIHRTGPVENGLRAFAVYKFTDVGLLLGVVTLHHHAGSASIEALSTLHGPEALLVGLLIIFGAMGKGALFPFTPWLPRAMEGPTPSSAIFYGALSIHASPFLLLRISPLILGDLRLQAVVIALGALTTLYATMVGRVQTDIKSTLGFAAVSQVGLIWIWIGLGFTQLALLHIVGHAILRTWQLLRSPSLFLDRRALREQLDAHPAATGIVWERLVPLRLRRQLYRFALERWHLETFWSGLHRTASSLLSTIDHLDQRWANVFREDFSVPQDVLQTESVEETAP